MLCIKYIKLFTLNGRNKKVFVKCNLSGLVCVGVFLFYSRSCLWMETFLCIYCSSLMSGSRWLGFHFFLCVFSAQTIGRMGGGLAAEGEVNERWCYLFGLEEWKTSRRITNSVSPLRLPVGARRTSRVFVWHVGVSEGFMCVTSVCVNSLCQMGDRRPNVFTF